MHTAIEGETLEGHMIDLLDSACWSLRINLETSRPLAHADLEIPDFAEEINLSQTNAGFPELPGISRK